VKGNGPIHETPRTPTPETLSASTAKTPRKFPIRKAILKVKHLVRPALRTQTRGADVGAEGATVEAEVAAGAESTTKKENGIASSTRRMTTTAQTIAQTIKDLRLSSKRKGRRRRGLVL
jgi:hypothetical protein